MKSNYKLSESGNQDFQNIYNRASELVEQARRSAYRQINETLVRRNWLLGKLIANEELKGDSRAKYGLNLIINLSKELSSKFGKGFKRRDLYNYLTFFKQYGNLFHTNDEIVYSVSTQSGKLLSWTHYRTLIQELNVDARKWYEQEEAIHQKTIFYLQQMNKDDE